MRRGRGGARELDAGGDEADAVSTRPHGRRAGRVDYGGGVRRWDRV